MAVPAGDAQTRSARTSRTHRTRTRRTARTRLARTLLGLTAGALVFATALTGCSNDPLAEQYRAGTDKGYISGSGVTEVPRDQRGEPLDFSGVDEHGDTISAERFRGDVLVLNFWYAECGPCRVEAKDLQSLHERFADDGVAFLGVNTRDSAAKAKAFDREFGVTYPSILDADGGAVQLAFSGVYRPNATPTTFVIDRDGRVAARMEGSISVQPSTLRTLIQDAIEEGD